MTLPLELGGIENPDVRRAFEQVSTQFPLRASSLANDVLVLAATGTARKVAFGVASFVFTAATVVTVAGVAHGLGATPKAIVAMTSAASAGGMSYNSANEGATTFDLRAVAPSAITGTVTAWWVAIG